MKDLFKNIYSISAYAKKNKVSRTAVDKWVNSSKGSKEKTLNPVNGKRFKKYNVNGLNFIVEF